MKLYTYFRSTAAYRIRIALNYKNIPHELIPIDLMEGAQKDPAYQLINPHARVPTLVDDTFKLGQSFAILEYLEEKFPEPHMLPQSLEDRALARYIAQIIVCDMHPLNNSGTLKFLTQEFKHNNEDILRWYFHWLKNGFDSLEALIAKRSDGKFCLKNQLSYADICLIPQIYNAHRFKFDMDAYPTLMSIYNHCLTLDYFDKAKPENQADFKGAELNFGTLK